MNGSEILNLARQHLSNAIGKSQTPIPNRLPISPWIAMSALQKAIRRGNEPIAYRAAATLLEIAPERLWRRCGAIAFEDVGVADLETVSLVTAALAGKRFQSELGGEWNVASFIISRMVGAKKCRAADDLLLAAQLHPAYALAREEYAEMSTSHLLSIAIGTGPLPERAIALWYAIGTDRRRSSHLHYRRGEPQAAFDFLCESGYPDTVVETAREGFRKVGEVLCPFVALLHRESPGETTQPSDDEFPAEVMIGDVPAWAYDLYSREGRRALGTFLEGDSQTARWVRGHVPTSKRLHFLGTVLFRVEGGLCRNRLRWAAGDHLRLLVDHGCHGRHCPDGTEILDLMRRDIPLMNQVRSHVS